MVCPLMKGREKTNYWGECERAHCALWDADHSQCAIKTFLIPPRENKIEDTELNDLQILNNTVEDLTAATKRISTGLQSYLDRERSKSF